MQFTLKALFDDETRKQIRTAVLGEAKTIARNEIDVAVRDEVKRLGFELVGKLKDSNDWRLRSMLQDAVRNVLTVDHWNETLRQAFEQMLQQLLEGRLAKMAKAVVEQAADKVIAEKMKKLTVWKAEDQDDYVRKVVGHELRKIVKLKAKEFDALNKLLND